MFLKAKADASKADNPNWLEAMKSPFADEYQKAATKEIDTLEKMDCWDVVDCPEGAHVIDSTWAFKIKHYPDSLSTTIKARFCVHGDQHIHGVDFVDLCYSCSIDINLCDAYFGSLTQFEVQAG